MPSTGNRDHYHGPLLLNHAGGQLAPLGDVDVDHANGHRDSSCGRLSRRRPRATSAGARTASALGREKSLPSAAAATIALRSLLLILALLSRPTAAAAAGFSTAASVAPAATADSAATAPPWILRGRGGGGGGAKGTAAAPAYARNPPRDGVLYDELEVHWGATAREIKKAYYRLAVQHHPDKKPGDAQAEDRFKRVSEAYQILQDDAVREKYHRHGVSALEEDSWGDSGDVGGEDGGGGGSGRESHGGRRRVDPMEVFRMFLGGGMFEHLIGPLSPRMVPVRDPDYHHQKSKVLAEELERRLELDLQGNSLWFDQAAWAEALQLRDQSMGRQILRTVGYVYKNYAQRSLGKLAPNVLQPQALKGRMKFYSDQAHRVNNILSAVSSTTRLYVHLQTRKPDQSSSSKRGGRHKGGRTPVERHSADEEETVTRVLEALWSVHRVDVEHTVQRACKMVLRDPRAPPSVLKKRAEALLRLGTIFTAAAKGKHPDAGTFRSVENAPDPFATSAPAASNAGAGNGSSPPPFAGYSGGGGGGYSGYGPVGSSNDNNNNNGEGGRGFNGGPAEGWREEGGGSGDLGKEQEHGRSPPPPPPPSQGFFGSFGIVGGDEPWRDHGAGQRVDGNLRSGSDSAASGGGDFYGGAESGFEANTAYFAEGMGGNGSDEGEYAGGGTCCVRQGDTEGAPWGGGADSAAAGDAAPAGEAWSHPPDFSYDLGASTAYGEISGISGGSSERSRSRQGGPGEMDNRWAGSMGPVDPGGDQGLRRDPSWAQTPREGGCGSDER